MKQMLSTILVIAVKAFDGKYDKGGQPYILHCLTVMHYLKTQDEELQCIAIGHDLIEDCDITYQDLWDAGISQRVIEGIKALTKVKGETYEEYKKKVKANTDAVLVKMQDLRHNSDIRRLKGVTEKDILRVKRYHEFYLELKELV